MALGEIKLIYFPTGRTSLPFAQSICLQEFLIESAILEIFVTISGCFEANQSAL